MPVPWAHGVSVINSRKQNLDLCSRVQACDRQTNIGTDLETPHYRNTGPTACISGIRFRIRTLQRQTAPTRLKYNLLDRLIGVGLRIVLAAYVIFSWLSSVSRNVTLTSSSPGNPASPSGLLRFITMWSTSMRADHSRYKRHIHYWAIGQTEGNNPQTLLLRVNNLNFTGILQAFFIFWFKVQNLFSTTYLVDSTTLKILD